MNIGSGRAGLLAILGISCAMPVAAQEAVRIGNETKRAVGTVVALDAGDLGCHIKLKDDGGAVFQEMALFEVCEQRTLVGKRVTLTYALQNVKSPDCQGDLDCKKTIRVAVVKTAMPSPTSATAANTNPSSLCSQQETVVFSCRTGDRMVSVCSSKSADSTRGYLQYRFGKPTSPEALELILPEARLPPPKAAVGENVPFAGGGGSWLRFTRSPIAYTVYSGIGKWGPNGETREKAGVAVERNGVRVAHLRCDGRPVSELGPDWFEGSGIGSGGQDFKFPD